jgi:hypothetical protein
LGSFRKNHCCSLRQAHFSAAAIQGANVNVTGFAADGISVHILGIQELVAGHPMVFMLLREAIWLRKPRVYPHQPWRWDNRQTYILQTKLTCHTHQSS